MSIILNSEISDNSTTFSLSEDSLLTNQRVLEPSINTNNTNTNTNNTDLNGGTNSPHNGSFKRIFKKSISKKYTLGKLKNKNCVAILLKDRNTRKKILSAQKDLKQHSINDIKTYLRNHNLVKIGSAAPNNVIRKLYESAMLSGEITNKNSDNLIHNFIKEDKEL